MATIGGGEVDKDLVNLERWYRRDSHPTLYGTFSEPELQQLFLEDLSAGRTVPLVLTAVILVGVVLATISVLACW